MRKLCAIAVSLFVVCSSRWLVFGGAEIIFRAGNIQPESSPWNQGLDRLRELVGRYTGGRIELIVYPNATFAADPNLIRHCQEGTLDMYVGDPAAGTSALAKELELFALPFLFRDYEHWKNALDGPPGQKYSRIIEEKTGLRIVGYWGGSSRNLIAVNKPVASIDDLKEFRIRLTPSLIKFQVWQAIGTRPVNIVFGEAYDAMINGFCDGMENELSAIIVNKLYEPARFLTMTEHEITVRPVFINAKSMDRLSPQIKAAFMLAMVEATDHARRVEKEIDDRAISDLTGKFGMILTRIDREPFKKATADIIRRFGEETGLTGLIQELKTFPRESGSPTG
ncbi:MAG: TRAP transporter substrate-binding protein [Planctomycetota bacterium]|jgi:tripartite ATP-independent transporter DctP family solute receptor|nr:TRAP transporter substrate-binding protein [Planctomycetota bacterium]